MMASPIAAVALALSLLAGPAEAQAPSESVAREVSGASPLAAAQEPGPSVAPPSGLPRRAPEARTMAGYWPVFAGFALVWVGIVGYLLTMGERSKRLARELAELEARGR